MLSSYNTPVAVGPTSPQPGVASTSGADNTTHPHSSRTGNCHHIWLVTGPAGSGKSTVAQYLASSLNLAYVEGDEFHPPANIEKMRNGIPLTDADRWDWLTALREESVRRIASGSDAVVLTCSALKRKYRDVIRVAPYFNTGVNLHFIYLSTDPEILLKRVTGRQGHYMGSNMVQSQLDILEPPQADETDVVCIDVGPPIEEVKEAVLQKVKSITEEEKA